MDQLVVITGLAGSGKSLAADAFEDLGYFCVDNLPVGLIHPFCDLLQRGGQRVPLAALVIDAREGTYLEQFPDILRSLRARGTPVQLVFFDSDDQVLKRRFNESRRPHPMSVAGGTLEQAIAAEREALQPLHGLADRIIDTSQLTPHQLRDFLSRAFGAKSKRDVPNVNVVSFGFKYGLPAESDLVFDVRFLPNPHFVQDLRPLDGRSPRVQAFLDEAAVLPAFIERLNGLVDFLVPLYGAEGKTYLTVAIGCTGGKHRSVALAERLGQYLRQREVPATVSHRDLGRE
jgi:UPF0042 nucleotide-binding protein